LQFSGAVANSALEMAGMDRYMKLQQDQVPFKVRAKRGCATHPRSIAERVRIVYSVSFISADDTTHNREIPLTHSFCLLVVQERRMRISEKLRKLQELVPNMDKVRSSNYHTPRRYYRLLPACSMRRDMCPSRETNQTRLTRGIRMSLLAANEHGGHVGLCS
jgi:hypothetical protein